MNAPKWMHTVPLRLRSLFRRERVEQDLDDELAYHVEQKTQQYIAQGLSPSEARRMAVRSMHGIEQQKEACRDTRRVGFVEDLWNDVAYGSRILQRTPVITTVAILSLALGIGANTAIFSLIDTVMLRFLPVQKPEQLMRIDRLRPGAKEVNAYQTNILWEQIRDQQDVFSGVFAWGAENFDLARGGAVQLGAGLFVSGSYFNTLGVQPAAGRLLEDSDDRRGCPSTAVLSHAFWQQHFGGAANAIGSTLSLDNHEFQIIGVSAKGFQGVEVGSPFDVAVPICTADVIDGKQSRLNERSWWWLAIMGRLKPGVSAEQAQARLGTLSPSIFGAAVPQDWAAEDQAKFVKAVWKTSPAPTGRSDLRAQFGEPLNILMAVVGLVLLIACANIATLMLSRSAVRSREIAVRKALGASRMRLIRQLLTECLLLSLAGAFLGALFARWGSALLVRYISTTNTPVSLDFALDARVLGFTAGIAVLTGLLFGVLPAFRSTRVSLTAAMKGTQTEPSERRIKFRAGRWIVALQVALSLVLLVGAGLFLQSFANLISLDAGFDRSNVLLVTTDLKTAKVPQEQWPETAEEIERRLRALPGVISVGRSVITPISGREWNNSIQVDSPNAPTGDNALVFFNFVSPGFLRTLRTPLKAGREFNETDTKSSPLVSIVNETLARKFFTGKNPVGQHFKVEVRSGKFRSVEVVGVATDAKYDSLREDTPPAAYYPILQVPDDVNPQTFELRTAIDPWRMRASVQENVASVNKMIPLDFGTLEQQVDDSLAQERLLATLSGFFGGLALLLAMIGLYGAISYMVTQRKIEFGIRMALGAPQISILELVMRDVAFILTVGVAAGAGIAFAATLLLQKMLFGLAPHDPGTTILAIVVLSAVAVMACCIPARRAMRVDPMVALRYE